MKPEERERLAEQWLDAQLKQYGQVEPRVGLEARILMNVQDRAHQEHQIWRWQRWPGRAAIAAILVASGTVLWLTRVAPHPGGIVPVASTARETSAPGPARQSELGAHEATQAPPGDVKGRTKLARSAVIAKSDPASPRLEQFPSPQPLSEQERILADYVAQFRHEAVLVAEAQTKLAQQNALETQMLSSDEDVTRSSREPR